MIKNSDFSLGTYRTQATAALGANVLFRHPSHILAAERAALTPSPAPALRERGELVSGLGIVDRRRRRIATATRTSPLPLPVAERQGTRGKVRGHHPPFLSRSAGEEGGWGEGEGHQVCSAVLAL